MLIGYPATSITPMPSWKKGYRRVSSGSQLSLGLRESQFFELNSLPNNPFDPFIDTGLPMQLGQEGGTSG